jgi:hypothetical protein
MFHQSLSFAKLGFIKLGYFVLTRQSPFLIRGFAFTATFSAPMLTNFGQ